MFSCLHFNIFILYPIAIDNHNGLIWDQTVTINENFQIYLNENIWI